MFYALAECWLRRGCLGKGPRLAQKDPMYLLLSPQAACGIEEDLRVHHFPGHVAITIAPAREGNDDAVGQNRQRIGNELLLQLISGRQVPEQPWGAETITQFVPGSGCPRDQGNSPSLDSSEWTLLKCHLPGSPGL